VEEIIMKMKKLGIVVFLVAVSLAMGSASATDVTSSMTNTQIQNAIDTDTSGTINFAPGTYTGVYLTTTKSLNFVGNGAVLVGDGSHNVLTISSTTGTNITGFVVNVNGLKNGITGQYVYNCRIENNTIRNGGDAINIYKQYGSLTINNNTINNMSTSYGDGISLVNCLNAETSTSTTVTNNVIDDTDYGIFLGGYFKGTVTGNTLTNIGATGMNITGKNAATTGNLYANITNNDITSNGIGISMENPDVVYLNLTGNTVSSGSDSLHKGYYYYRDPSIQLINDPDDNDYNNVWDPLTSNGH
jgi:hypothetical protein